MFITFDQEAQDLIRMGVSQANIIHPEIDWEAVGFSAGYSGYGRYRGRYISEAAIVELSYNPKHRISRLTNQGIRVINKERFHGTLMHELAHHAQYVGDHPYRRGGGHCTPSWFWALVNQMDYFGTNPGITIEEWVEAWDRVSDPRDRGAMFTYRDYHPMDNHGWVKKTIDYVLSGQRARDKVEARRRVCGHCEGEFQAKREDAKFCSTKCRTAAHRARKAATAKAETTAAA